MYKLEVQNTAFKGKRFLFRDGLTVGSGPTCTIRAQHHELEDVHVRFFAAPTGAAMVEVANEKAHLFVNGKDVLRSELRHNDELVVGPLRFKVLDNSRQSSTTLRIDQLVEELDAHKGEDIYDFAREDLFYLITKDPSLREAISFTIPSKDRFIDQAQVFLTRLVKQCSMDEDQVEGFMTCAKELILNAHRHGHQFDESKVITLRYRDLGERLALTIDDQGAGFDHKAMLEGVRTKNAAQAARDRYKAGGFGGLGFQLVTKLVSDLRYNDAGNRVTFTLPKTKGGSEGDAGGRPG